MRSANFTNALLTRQNLGKLKREIMKTLYRHIPNGYELIYKHESLGLEIYAKDEPAIVGLCFAGRGGKPIWHYRFSSIEQRLKQIEKTFSDLTARAEAKEKYKAEKKGLIHDVKPGNIFKCSWGYDQTNIDFYQCIEVKGKMGVFCEIGQDSEENGFLQGQCVPVPNQFRGKPFRKLIQMTSKDSEPFIKINSFSWCRRFKPMAVIDNKPIFESTQWTAYA